MRFHQRTFASRGWRRQHRYCSVDVATATHCVGGIFMAAMKNGRTVDIRIAKRYVRSVELNRDLEDPDALDGYVITPSVRDAVRRILSGLVQSSTQRAFRITGPYGAGKSAFAVLL